MPPTLKELDPLPSTAPSSTPGLRWSPARDNLRGHLMRGAQRLAALLLVDVGAVLLGRELLRAIRDGLAGQRLGNAVAGFLPMSAVSAVPLAVALVLTMIFMGGYRTGDFWKEPVRALAGAGAAVVLATYADLWHESPGLVLARGLVVWALLGLTLVAARGVLGWVVSYLPRRGWEHRVLEIVGEGGEAANGDLGGGYRTLATLESSQLPRQLDAMEDWLEGGVDTILVSGLIPAAQFAAITDFALAHGCRLLTVPRSPELVTVDPKRIWLKGRPYFEITTPSLRASQIVVKRGLDLVVSAVSLVLLAPLLFVLAAWVRWDSPGPALFRQQRPGLRGRPFGMFKFRSMRQDAEEILRGDPALYQKFILNDCKLPEDEDPRITRSGRFLRKTSLDELPQLINVFRGEMSLVGPRPLVGPELDHYADRAVALLSVKPGMTGQWQISGRSEVVFPYRAEIDLDYMRNWSFLKDLWILVMTVPTVLMRRGAH